MKKLKYSLLSLLLMSVLCAFSQETSLELVRYDDYHWTYRYHSGSLTVREIETDAGLFTQLNLPEHQYSTNVGAPQIPVSVNLVEIPFCEDVKIEVVNEKINYVKASDLNISSPVYPAQMSYSKNDELGKFEQDRKIYSADAFYGLEKVSIEKRGTMRWANLAALTVAPIRYNPVTEEFAVTEELEFTITFVQPDLAKTNELRQVHANNSFARQFDYFLLPSPVYTKGVIYPSPTKYLIVSDPMFEDELQRFIAWKKQLGFVVEVGYTNEPEVGKTKESIRQYILNKYQTATPENPAPTYVLLVGDIEQIPAFRGKTRKFYTDFDYCEWTGDNLPDCYYGRFSAQNVDQLAVQIDKTLAYEQCDFEDATYLNDAVLVSGYDLTFAPTYSNGQVNYLANQYVNEQNGFRNVRKIRDEDGVKPEVTRAEVAKGVGFVNYTAHCGTYGWRNPRFDTTHVKELPSVGKYCFMLANCCESGRFEVSACFAEAMMRAKDKGAASYIGASDETYWDEDYYWTIGYRSFIDSMPSYNERYLGAFDKMFHTHGEPQSSWAVTNGAIVSAGNLSVEKTMSTLKQYYWEIYHVFGDPSMIVWLTQPKPMPIIARDTLPFGAASLAVETAPYASVSLTYDKNWVASANANANGKATLRFPALLQPGKYKISSSAQNFMHGFKEISLMPIDSMQLLMKGLSLAEHSSMEVGNSVNLNLTLSNVGKVALDSIHLQISCTDTMVQFIQSECQVDRLAFKDTLIQNAFTAILPDSISDQTILNFDVAASYAHKSDTARFFFLVAAPDFVTEEVATEEQEGNGNEIIESGETVRMTIVSQNVGHVKVDSVTVSLSTDYKGVEVLSSAMTVFDESKTGSFVSQFDFKIAADVKPLSVIPLYHKIKVNGMSFVDTIYIMVGSAVEDFESGAFAIFPWEHGMYPWTVVKGKAVSGNYCARSAEGLKNGQQSTFSILLNVLYPDSISYYRKVSSEKDYDKFSLIMDANILDLASGELNWTRVAFPVSQGTHLFTFSYQKDAADFQGQDAAFVDDIRLPASSNIVAIIQPEKNSTGRIYPNPTADKFVVESENLIQTLEIFDITGKCIEKISNIASHFCEIDIQRFESGSYLVRTIGSNQEVSVYKLIKY